MKRERPVLVLGGGVAGLTVAEELARNRVEVLLLEKQGQAGWTCGPMGMHGHGALSEVFSLYRDGPEEAGHREPAHRRSTPAGNWEAFRSRTMRSGRR